MEAVKRQYLKYACKGAIVAFLSLFIAYIFGIKQYYWVLFGAITVLKLNIGASFRRGKERLLGTFSGVIASMLLVNIFVDWPLGVYLLLPLFFFLAIYYFHDYFIAMFFITLAFVLALGIQTQHPLNFGLMRILDTLLGVAIAFFVSLFLWPESVKNMLSLELAEFLEKTKQLSIEFGSAFLQKPIDVRHKREAVIALDNLFLNVQEDFDLLAHEPGRRKYAAEKKEKLMLVLDRLRGIISLLGYLAVSSQCKSSLPKNTAQKLSLITQETNNVLSQLISQLQVPANSSAEQLENKSSSEQNALLIDREITDVTLEIKSLVKAGGCPRELAIMVYSYLQNMQDFIQQLRALNKLNLSIEAY